MSEAPKGEAVNLTRGEIAREQRRDAVPGGVVQADDAPAGASGQAGDPGMARILFRQRLAVLQSAHAQLFLAWQMLTPTDRQALVRAFDASGQGVVLALLAEDDLGTLGADLAYLADAAAEVLEP